MSKRIIVTGGNRGIGYQILLELAGKGHEIILAARNKEQGKKIAHDLNAKNLKVEFHQLDLEFSESINSFAEVISKEYNSVDVLINNAGVFQDRNNSSLSVDMEALKRTMQINLYGSIELSKLMIDILKKSQEGRIINMSSGLGALHDMGGGYTAYRLSKAGLNAFTKILASDLTGTNIKVNAMCPGWVKTDMGGKSAPRSLEQGADTAVWLATAENIPNGKFLRDRKEIQW